MTDTRSQSSASIVERLRYQIVPDGWLELAEEATSEIEWLIVIIEWYDKLDLERIAEIERLRAALRHIADGPDGMADIARRALEN